MERVETALVRDRFRSSSELWLLVEVSGSVKIIRSKRGNTSFSFRVVVEEGLFCSSRSDDDGEDGEDKVDG